MKEEPRQKQPQKPRGGQRPIEEVTPHFEDMSLEEHLDEKVVAT